MAKLAAETNRGWWPNWRHLLRGVRHRLDADNVGIVAAGVAFAVFLAVFPALIATISIYGLVMDPQEIEQQLQELAGLLPPQAQELIGQQLRTIAQPAANALGWGLIASILMALWSANAGMKALFKAINIAYDTPDQRGFLKQTGLTLLFTIGGVLTIILVAALVVALPVALRALEIPTALQTTLRVARWLAMAGMILLALALLYRFAPDRPTPRWRWLNWGSIIATTLWLAASWGFAFYVEQFGSYNKIYGALAAVVILLLWLWLSSFAILLGAEINAELERSAKGAPQTDQS